MLQFNGIDGCFCFRNCCQVVSAAVVTDFMPCVSLLLAVMYCSLYCAACLDGLNSSAVAFLIHSWLRSSLYSHCELISNGK